jgi:hypothetical protein
MIKITDDELVKFLVGWIKDSDADELAELVEFFGGHCFYNNETENYEFIPDENYCGVFDYLK